MKIILTLIDPTPEPALIVINQAGRTCAIDIGAWLEASPARLLSPGIPVSDDPTLTISGEWEWDDLNENLVMHSLTAQVAHWRADDAGRTVTTFHLVEYDGRVFASLSESELLALDRSVRQFETDPLRKAS
jgi:hypothetical protein